MTQQLRGGQAYDYQVALKAGQALKATVEQKRVDVVVVAYDPSGTELATFNSPTGAAENEVVTVPPPPAATASP